MNNDTHCMKSFSWQPIGSILQIEGSAIMPGVFTGLDKIPTEFHAEVIAQARKNLLNKPALAYGHGDDIGDSPVVGYITATDLVDDRLRIKGYLFNETAIRHVIDGKIRGLSIEATANVTGGKDRQVVKDFAIHRISLVDQPACKACVIDSMKEVKQLAEDPKPTESAVQAAIQPAAIPTSTTSVSITTPTLTTGDVSVVAPAVIPTITAPSAPKEMGAPTIIPEKIVTVPVEKKLSDFLGDPLQVEELAKIFGESLAKTKIPAGSIELLKGLIVKAFAAANSDTTLDSLWESAENPYRTKMQAAEINDLVGKIKAKDKAFCQVKALEGITDHIQKLAVLSKMLEAYELADTKKVELSAAAPAKDELKDKVDKASQALFGKPYGEVIKEIDDKRRNK